jgi:hypothetical protein
VPRQKSVTSQRERAVPDVVTHRYGNGNMAAQTTWPPEVDLIFLRNMNTEYMLYVSYFSYHRPLLNRLSVKL